MGKKCFVRAPSAAPCGPRPFSRFGVARRSGPGDDLLPHDLQLFCSPLNPFIQPVNENQGAASAVVAGWPDVAFYVSLVSDRHVTITPWLSRVACESQLNIALRTMILKQALCLLSDWRGRGISKDLFGYRYSAA